ncbi:DMT family transporter [Xylophilus sp.]|uniref:DMT family transporter n=1 Tax=Xylophilus sp. TaxID=2653893 RepID=UPI0013B95C2A|nr:DMT family transporter [Xylophilus sp.]KAF1047780.1 MAG: hypothetical protein GAK38_01723 [Xylophilus sp.]
MEATGRTRLAGVLCGLAAALIWGGFPVMTRLGVAYSSFDLYDVTFLRFSVAGLLLAPVLVRTGFGRLGPVPVALMVAGIGAPYMLVVSQGLALAPVSLFAALTPGSMIGFSVLLSVLWLGNRVPLRERAGLALIAAGIGAAGWQGMAQSVGAGAAVGSFLAGGLLWAIYTVSTRAFSVGPLHATAIVSVVSALVYAPVYVAMKGSAILEAPLRALAGQAIYQGAMVSIAALYFYSKAVALLGPVAGASFAALVPVFAVIEASLLLGEAPGLPSVAALAVVTVGLVVSIASKNAGTR